MRIVLIAVLSATAAQAGFAMQPEKFCSKSSTTFWDENTTIACYTDAGCRYAEGLGAFAARDYDVTSVTAALARERIEGIVTSSTSIMKSIAASGYVCVPLWPYGARALNIVSKS